MTFAAPKKVKRKKKVVKGNFHLRHDYFKRPECIRLDLL